MNFFQQQDRTRRNTKVLVLFFVLAVVLIVVAVYFASTWIYFLSKTYTGVPSLYALWDPELFAWVSMGTLGVIAMGSLYMHQVLSSGGTAVALRLGAIPVSPSTKDLNERRLFNVVEEMAIASGTAVPSVFILPQEHGINAFAAGFTSSDAVVAVTEGTLKELSRDELQGVIAHEFSHIVNGDMKLNQRLTSILHGILIIGLTGYWILRIMGQGRIRSDRKGGGALLVIPLVGLILLIIGFIGLFFGRLIKSGVSRQRELLADSSGVQFTRNPQGLAGALKKIGGFSLGSKVLGGRAEEFSHMFFVNALSNSFVRWMATHPPLEERIHALDPTFSKTEISRVQPTPPSSSFAKPALSSKEVLSFVGRPAEKHLAYASSFLPSLPEPITRAIHLPREAMAMVYALIGSSAAEFEQLKKHEEPTTVEKANELRSLMKNLEPSAYLSILDLSLPALRQLSKPEYTRFMDTLKAMMLADRRISLFEFSLYKILKRHLSSTFGKTRKGRVKFRSIQAISSPLQITLSALAHAGNPTLDAAQTAYLKGVQHLQIKSLPLLPQDACDMIHLNRAFDELDASASLLKREVLEAAVRVVSADGQIHSNEAEFLRALGDTLDTPIPPLI